MKKDELNTDDQPKLPAGHVVAEEVAIADVTNFVNLFKFKPVDENELQKDFAEIIYAVQLGVLKLDEKAPVLTLSKPLLKPDGAVYKEEVTFKTRIIASEQEKIARGMDLKNQTLLYVQKSQAYLIGEPVVMLDKFNRGDLKIIEQLTGLFM